MAILDCFQYFNEDHIADLRFNILNEFVDKFVIVESTVNHQGKPKKLHFDIEKYKKFKDKINYIIVDDTPESIKKPHIGGESLVEQHQRNSLIEGIKDASPDDLIILSDSDEIPDLSKLSLIKNSKKFIAFSQKMFMYKLNLQNLKESGWIGSRITKKKNLRSMQELRNLKFKLYPFWRLDKINQQIIEGGWHFSYMQSPKQILNKIKSFSHGEYNNKNLNEKIIEEKIVKGEDIFGRDNKLRKIDIDDSYPKFIAQNKEKFSDWII